jgi:Zn-dependent peptidase ImmA (M78 family)/transcriptional regulator with XRE-family HTH domain
MADFNYTRLEVARKRRGLTKTALAKEAGISTRSLTKFEREGYMPGQATVARLARAVDFPPAFFFGDTLEEPSTEGSSFRAFTSATARQKGEAMSSGALSMNLAQWIEARFSLPDPDVPTYPDIDPETAAEAVRDLWGLGSRPIRNVVHLLEAHGVRVFALPDLGREVDGFSIWQGSIPYVFLNTSKTAERSRMDAAHELGHLVLHAHGGPRGRDAEKEAHAFGAALLMPEQTILAEIPYGATFRQLVRAKSKWKVSVLNLARRAHDLDLLTEWQYRSICVEASRRGKDNEPAPMKHRETSQILDKVFRALRSEGVSRAAVARELQIPLEELNDSLAGLMSIQAIGGDLDAGSGAHAEVPEPPRRPNLRIVG